METRDLVQLVRGGLLQQDRLLKLETTLGSNVLVPHRMVGRSTIGRQFEMQVDVVSSHDDVELKALIAQPVTLWIQQADETYRPHHGYVHTVRRLGTDGGLAFYQVTFASWLQFLKFRRDQRIWQDRSVDEIVTDVFNAHPQAKGFFSFDLTHPLPKRSFCRQNETDWNFVHRLLESEGLFGYWRQADDGKSHKLVITDRLTSLEQSVPVQFYRSGVYSEADALTQWSGTRMLQSATLTTRTFDYKNPVPSSNPKGTTLPTMPNQGNLPEQTEVYEYTGAYTYLKQERGDQLSRIRMEEWESRAKRFHGSGAWRAADAAMRFTLQDHPEHDHDSQEHREFVAISVSWTIENNLPISNLNRRFPHSLQDALIDAREADESDVVFKVSAPDGGEGFYRIEIEAQRTAVPYRSPFEHEKPATHLETAIVVGPSNEEVFTDELNRIKVQFIWDRVSGPDERASCWIRVAQSDTGNGYGAVHPPRVGEEVLVDYVGGDCDRPIAIARVYNGATKPQWHSNGLLSGFRSKEYSGAGFNQLVMDDSTGQNRAQLYSSYGSSHLHLGYLIDQTGNTRGSYLGSGFDLRTDAYGAVRAARGIYVTTHPKSANSQLLDVRETQQQLIKAETLVESLSQVSVAHRAESLKVGYDSLKQFTDATQDNQSGTTTGGRTAGGGTGNANGFKEPVMLFGSPADIALSTQKSIQVTGDEQVTLVSGESVHVAAGKSLLASVAEKISLFAHNAGMKLFAGKGKVEIQAHADGIELTAQKAVKILSVADKIEVASDKEILLTSGGAYIRIANGDIEIHAPGKLDMKGAQHAYNGPTSMRYAMPSLPISTLQQVSSQEYTQVFNVSPLLDHAVYAAALAGQPYRIYLPDGTIQQQGMLINGATETVRTPTEMKVRCEIGEGDWVIDEHAYDHSEHADLQGGDALDRSDVVGNDNDRGNA
ncbi:type VI secretion system Vgr family protein [Burkholderia ubonensis]|uniref:type VI secretion system Vgr family protein n=1 Tax=Burkholderia ubonensis TaxID=101571 RepID=UPI00075F2B56|nr:type VI secretion system tip protein TssI/VgrG [Burkholderia ubonensis]KVX12340.1 type VI secretion protein [Burkholderia ubonensis]KVZ88685.1 type VI secretion protein [Burkholderia ubonensis]KWE36225.1 type VI secretion protein [Burkholderia ubonensis]